MKDAAQWVYAVLKFLLPVLLIAVGAMGAKQLIAGRERPKAAERPPQAKYVEVIPVEKTARPFSLSAYGTVQAHRAVTLQAQVMGSVVEQHPDLQQGAIIAKGETIAQLDRRDYEAAVAQESAALITARFNLKVEEGRQVVAKREWSLLDRSVESTELSEELALRKPHLEERQALVRAAESRLTRAELDLERTELRAPFDALVIEESIEVGQLVNQNSIVARLICVDEFHIEASVRVADLRWIQFPDAEHPTGAKVRISQEAVGRGEQEREGTVVGLLGEVDPGGRMARVLIEVPDPLGLESSQPFSLLVGQYVSVEIEGPTLRDVVVIPRAGIREGDEVWVMDRDQRLAVRSVKRIFASATEVVVEHHFEPGDQIIISALQVPLPGMLLSTTVGGDPADGAESR